MKEKSNIITWGNNHKRYIKNIEQAKLIAYEKAFYFENVKLNGVQVTHNM